MAFLVWVAVKAQKAALLAERIKAINGDHPISENDEVLSATSLKGNATNLAEADMLAFLDWLLGPSLNEVRTASAIRDQLLMLKRQRLARLHVFCPDGPIPKSKSMSGYALAASHFLWLPQGPRRQSKSCSGWCSRPLGCSP